MCRWWTGCCGDGCGYQGRSDAVNQHEEGGYPLKDARPWLDPCTAGVRAPAKTKPAVERKG